jgi:hypothetical protein
MKPPPPSPGPSPSFPGQRCIAARHASKNTRSVAWLQALQAPSINLFRRVAGETGSYANKLPSLPCAHLILPPPIQATTTSFLYGLQSCDIKTGLRGRANIPLPALSADQVRPERPQPPALGGPYEPRGVIPPDGGRAGILPSISSTRAGPATRVAAPSLMAARGGA